LGKIREWIDAESQNPLVATRFLSELFKACEELKVFPQRFAAYSFARRWRMMPFGNYLVFFTVAGDEVRVGHVRHAARTPLSG
jgi:plasmid stabilization system protein ParE